MKRKGVSHFIESNGPDDSALARGIRWLVQEGKKSGNQGMIAVSGKPILDNIVVWSKLEPWLKELRTRKVTELDGVTISLFTLRTDDIYEYEGPILVIYGRQDLLDKVDAIAGAASVLAIPFEKNAHADWVATWGATKLGDPPHPVVEPTSGPVLVALEGLTASVNLSTGIAHPSDYEEAVRTLETIFHKSSAVTPEIIRRQLIRLGWNPEDARSVRELADKIWAGKRPKKSTGRADDLLWEHWSKPK